VQILAPGREDLHIVEAGAGTRALDLSYGA